MARARARLERATIYDKVTGGATEDERRTNSQCDLGLEASGVLTFLLRARPMPTRSTLACLRQPGKSGCSPSGYAMFRHELTSYYTTTQQKLRYTSGRKWPQFSRFQ